MALWLTPTNGIGSGPYDGVARALWDGAQTLQIYHVSGRIQTFYNVPWTEVVAIMSANTATVATAATPDAEIKLNVAGVYGEGT